MRITMYVTDEALQFNIEVDGDLYSYFASLMKKYKGEVTIHEGVNIGLTNGGI